VCQKSISVNIRGISDSEFYLQLPGLVGVISVPTLREEQGLREFENRVPRNTLGPKREEVTHR
jgi:hypothetical protein